MSEKINLPGSSFEELKKIIIGYASSGDGTSLEELAKLTGIGRSTISRNNLFLKDISIIQGGRSRAATDLGVKLARAIEHKQTEDETEFWTQAINSNEGIAKLITTLRIKDGMSRADFAKHILYVSGQNDTKNNKTGVNTVIEIFLTSKLIEEIDGNLTISKPKTENIGNSFEQRTKEHKGGKETSLSPNKSNASPNIDLSSLSNPPQIIINVQLQLPKTENAEVYEKLFKALRDNLLYSHE